MLGFDAILGLETIANFYNKFNDHTRQEAIIETLCGMSLSIGILERETAPAEGLSDIESDVAFMAELLAHLGTIVLVANFRNSAENADFVAQQITRYANATFSSGDKCLAGKIDNKYLSLVGKSGRMEAWTDIYHTLTKQINNS